MDDQALVDGFAGADDVAAGGGAERCAVCRNHHIASLTGDQWMDKLDDRIIETPEGPMTWAEWKKKNRLQIPSRRTKGKDLPVKVKLFTDIPRS